MSEDSKAIEETAKTIGFGIQAAQQFGTFISKLIGGSLEQGMGIFEDKLMYMRWDNQRRLMEEYNKVMNLENIISQPLKPIALKFAVPLFQAASLEDDDYLQELWVNLLVNSSTDGSGVELNRTYIDILERLSPLEAKILLKIYELPYEKIVDRGVLTIGLPEEVTLIQEDMRREDCVLKDETIILALSNLSRLGCIFQGGAFADDQIFGIARTTLLGRYVSESYTLNF